jgi:O-acetylhomoserine/O-acetylserine sulfhydrylase-like pyridoxal-dependent enzyme
MRRETLSVHAGYEDDPTTHAVAVPIYQTAAYSFDCADHAAALFNPEEEGFATAGSATRPPLSWSGVSPRWKAD